MKIVISRERKVEMESNELGIVGENKFEKLEFEFPAELENYYKTIEIQTSDEKYIDEIKNNEYTLTNAITKYSVVRAQIVAKDLSKNITFKSEIFKMKFKNSIGTIEEFEIEKKFLLDQIIIDIGQVNNKVEELEKKINQNQEAIATNAKNIQQNTEKLANKVEKAPGKDLSTNDYTTEEKKKLKELSNYDDTTIKKDISTNRENIKNNTTSIETLKSDNTNIKESISTNAENIQKNAEDVQKNVDSIEKLKLENTALRSQIPVRTSKWRKPTLNRQC